MVGEILYYTSATRCDEQFSLNSGVLSEKSHFDCGLLHYRSHLDYIICICICICICILFVFWLWPITLSLTFRLHHIELLLTSSLAPAGFLSIFIWHIHSCNCISSWIQLIFPTPGGQKILFDTFLKLHLVSFLLETNWCFLQVEGSHGCLSFYLIHSFVRLHFFLQSTEISYRLNSKDFIWY